MRKIIGIIVACLFLNNCGGGYSMFNPYIEKTHRDGGEIRNHFLSVKGYSGVASLARQYCRTNGYAGAQLGPAGRAGEFATYQFSCTNSGNTGNIIVTSSSSNTSSSSYSGTSSPINNYYSNASPKLFYDSSTGGMKECTHVPQNGNCLSFKPYKASNYNKSTLFYDSSSNSMKPCVGIVDLNGKCTAFGIYNGDTTPSDQLFYNPKTRQMTTCRFVTISGGCSQYDLVPRTGSTGGNYNIDSASNPYYKKVPRTNQQLMKSGMDMLGGNCTLGLNC